MTFQMTQKSRNSNVWVALPLVKWGNLENRGFIRVLKVVKSDQVCATLVKSKIENRVIHGSVNNLSSSKLDRPSFHRL